MYNIYTNLLKIWVENDIYLYCVKRVMSVIVIHNISSILSYYCIMFWSADICTCWYGNDEWQIGSGSENGSSLLELFTCRCHTQTENKMTRHHVSGQVNGQVRSQRSGLESIDTPPQSGPLNLIPSLRSELLKIYYPILYILNLTSLMTFTLTT